MFRVLPLEVGIITPTLTATIALERDFADIIVSSCSIKQIHGEMPYYYRSDLNQCSFAALQLPAMVVAYTMSKPLHPKPC